MPTMFACQDLGRPLPRGDCGDTVHDLHYDIFVEKVEQQAPGILPDSIKEAINNMIDQGYSAEFIGNQYGPRTQQAVEHYIQSQSYKAGHQSPDMSECSPTHHFRLLMLEKFREIDVELQQAMTLETMHRQHMHMARVIDVGAPAVGLDAECLGCVAINNKPFSSHVKVKANPGDGPACDMLACARSEAVEASEMLISPRDHGEEMQPLKIQMIASARTCGLKCPQANSLALTGVTAVNPDAGQCCVTNVLSSVSRVPAPLAAQSSVCTPARNSCTPIRNADITPENVFVINVRRLIDIQEKLFLLHDLLQSTAMAAITLPAAGIANQFCGTLLFLPVVFALFAMHERDWERLEVEDLKMLLPLLCDDIDPKYSGANPNRLFKAVSVETSRFLSRLFHLFHLVVAIGLALAWSTIEYRWQNPPPAGNSRGSGNSGGFRQKLADRWMVIHEDVEAMGMQVTLATLMFLLQGVFEYIHWRETSAVMPRAANDEAWDPRRHGTPAKYRLFGLPSMWFSSEEALQKLKTYIGKASANSERVTTIYPQELAYYALSGDGERAELQTSLNQCKLFERRTQSYIFDGAHPEKLELGLCFFDDKIHDKGFPYCGEFMYYQEDEIFSQNSNLSHHSHMVRSFEA